MLLSQCSRFRRAARTPCPAIHPASRPRARRARVAPPAPRHRVDVRVCRGAPGRLSSVRAAPGRRARAIARAARGRAHLRESRVTCLKSMPLYYSQCLLHSVRVAPGAGGPYLTKVIAEARQSPVPYCGTVYTGAGAAGSPTHLNASSRCAAQCCTCARVRAGGGATRSEAWHARAGALVCCWRAPVGASAGAAASPGRSRRRGRTCPWPGAGSSPARRGSRSGRRARCRGGRGRTRHRGRDGAGRRPAPATCRRSWS